MYALLCQPSSPSDSHQKPVAHTSSRRQLLASSRGSSTSELTGSLVVKMKRHDSWGQQKVLLCHWQWALGPRFGISFLLSTSSLWQLWHRTQSFTHARQLLYLPPPPPLRGFLPFVRKISFQQGRTCIQLPHCHQVGRWVCGSHSGQHIWCVLNKLHPGKTLLITMVSPLTGKDLCAFLYYIKFILPLKSN